MASDAERRMARRVADKYILRVEGPTVLAQRTARTVRLEVGALLDDVEKGLRDRGPAKTRAAARVAFAKLRALVSQDYDL